MQVYIEEWNEKKLLPILRSTDRFIQERDDFFIIDHILDFGNDTHSCNQPQCVFRWIRLDRHQDQMNIINDPFF